MPESMTAYRALGPGRAPELVSIPRPAPGPGQVLLRVGGAGVCGTDLEVVRTGVGGLPFTKPFTLGHENAGWVEDLGAGVEDLQPGQAVVVSAIQFCGACDHCAAGHENHCRSLSCRGLAEDGGFAPYMVADRRQLVELATLQPKHAAPLADAGLSAYHAVSNAVGHADRAETIALIGVGGLGGFAVQYAKALTQAQVIAVDRSEQRLRIARDLGADHALDADEHWGKRVTELTRGRGVDAVVDFVGSDETLRTAVGNTRGRGAVVVCGRGGGVLPFSRALVEPGVVVMSSRGGTMRDLEHVVRMAESGVARVEIEEFALNDIPKAIGLLREGGLTGRAVVTSPA
ncbi:D-arabinose 1-dehydrogenase [Saccharopolyspora erythraea NRRL 2338]|uniref:alcohol dehydrogenase n=2 Tax=Saccharopolyspora erythraea TaxID=1836 RepID=A4FD89_SACEN|nr:NAD(P)-dependent alcohol dehydrogenase [Saccharopolyspora erythraea]EQD83516.1 alcohol dehydrogenase [Saccharopolyspora erythraea D]PFG95757.1 D-arabinose 1-dehydrogenase [Saccharopolyspora erythraea NRRL 2338]QRK92347.1 NAD(P)-dependent alcohol dehydrogenase [Saccharopolyspora erythraea]CAM02014.1 alcohol dehydrogenase, zinc-binding [Saccharopolyspora erythraea NRRL 2338]